MAKSPRLCYGIRRVDHALDDVLPEEGFFTYRAPIFLSNPRMVLETDAQVVRGDLRSFRRRWPGPGEIQLVVETPETMPRRDRALKAKLYARASVPVCWILDAAERRLQVSSGPDGTHYRYHRALGPDESVPLILDGREVAHLRARDLLP